ncbi:MAG: ABC transporter ATP-binding protein [Hyphomicrobiales bacterium]|jgi:branched-chain amino acid transport system ATP-binding protein|nr:ABC transporter ATP-binding protein [Hyphomicrobiales bacterium]
MPVSTVKSQTDDVPALALASVGRRFGALVALQDVTLTLRHGERRAIIGANGAGKTTLFNTVTGDFPPTSGRILLAGRDITKMPPQARTRLGLRRTYQTPLLLDQLTVRDNFYVAVRGIRGGRLQLWRGADAGADEQEVLRLAELTGVLPLLGRRAVEISHGERRQVEIAMALAGTPDVLLLDEPAAGLSPGDRGTLTALLRSLPSSITIVLIEHDMDVALGFAEFVTVMHNGRVFCEGLPAAIAADQRVHEIYMGHRHG